MIAAGCDCDLSGGVAMAQVGSGQRGVMLVGSANNVPLERARKSFIEGEEGSGAAVSRSLGDAVAEVKTDFGSSEVSGEG